MNKTQRTTEQRDRRHARIRSKVIGTTERPRLSVFKSNTTLYVQLIDDSKATTVAQANSKEAKGATGVERAEQVGALIAKRATEKGVSAVVFDRGGFKFAGRIKVLADAARQAGLTF